MIQVKADVSSNILLLPDPGAWLLRVRAPDLVHARAGQYVMVRCGEGMEMPLRRPLTVHRTSAEGEIQLLYAVVGRGTEWLAGRREGDALDIIGPLGNGFDAVPPSSRVLLVAGGMGVAPMVSLACQSLAEGAFVTLVIGAGTVAGIYPDNLLPAGVSTIITTEDGSAGRKGMATDFIEELSRDADRVFACGPLEMYRKMAGLSCLAGKPVRLLLEAVLGCGMGACLSCTIETKSGPRKVCKDGPVFELSDILWDKITAPPARRR
ncbi:MAG: dihydroorotate dehydrogenase electron transfer subunit [Dehalococcoidia bacterium]|nr:dihydroorotate dehydrogenase electron transfer subunit [Dehalococcoidia bacterium]